MERFCGRKTELGKLGRVFARVQKGDTGTVLVSGPAGSGKTALVTRFAVEAERQGALFAYAKADITLGSTPFATVAAALDMLVKKAIAEPPVGDDILTPIIRQCLDTKDDDSLAALMALMPSLGYLFKDSRTHRFHRRQPDNQSTNLWLLSLLEALSAALKRPLVLFLDDLQWMDAASHGFLRYLAVSEDPSNRLLVLAHRPNDGGTGPDLELTAGLYKSLETTLTLPLTGLNRRDTRAWLARRLTADHDLVPLADLCHQKTAGNPLYIGRLVDELQEKEILFEADGAWTYDIAYISKMGFTENVADLIVRRIGLMEDEGLALLKQAACIQGEISVRQLMATSGFSREKIETLLWKPVHQDLLRKTRSAYAFAHDKILEAVGALIEEEEAWDIHRRLVAFFLTDRRRDDLDANIFTLLYHYGYYGPSVTDISVRTEMAGIYFHAGAKAQRQSAYDLALSNFIQGKEHYPGDIWDQDYDLALRFCRRIARCAYLAGDFDAADRIFAEVDAQARTFCDRSPMEMLKILCFQARQMEEAAITTGLALLRHLGISIPQNPSRLSIISAILKAWARYIFSPKARLVRKRLDPDSEIHKAVQCLSALGAMAYYLSPERLLPMVTARAFDLSVRHGNMEETPVCYMSFGMILNEITGGIKWGRRLGAMAREIGREFSDDRHKVKALTLGNVFLDHWDKTQAQGIRDFKAAETFCLRQGDHEYFGYNALGALHGMLISGMPLDTVEKEITSRKRVFDRINNQSALTTAGFIHQAVANLNRGVPRPWVLDGDHFKEARLDDTTGGTAAEFQFYKFCTAFYCGRTDKAAGIREILEFSDLMAIDAHQFYYFHFLSALVDIDLQQDRRTIRKHLKRLKKYSSRNEAIYGSRYLLALGERRRRRGDSRADETFREAVAAAQKHGYRFEEALAWEGLGKIAADAGDDAATQAHFGQAIGLYKAWGLKWRQGLFEFEIPAGRTTDEATPDSHDNGADANTPTRDPADGDGIEAILREMQRISGAEVIHAAARMAMNWKCCAYIDHRGVHRPAIFISMPERMLNFACTAGEVIRADAECIDAPFFDTEYYWSKRPPSLMVVPVGKDKGIYFENMADSSSEVDLLRLARRLFDLLDLPDAGVPGDNDTDHLDCVVHKRNSDRIQAHMAEKKSFKNPKLTLTVFAREFKMSQRAITDAINTRLGQNFRTFVNSYRVEAVKEAMNDPVNDDKTILEIALAQGFNSKSTFNEVFKQFVGTTPSEYMTARAEKSGIDRQRAS